MLLHKSLKENIKPACSISYVIVESDGAERHQRGSEESLDYRADAERLREAEHAGALYTSASSSPAIVVLTILILLAIFGVLSRGTAIVQ